jgi:hypothetical protein
MVMFLTLTSVTLKSRSNKKTGFLEGLKKIAVVPVTRPTVFFAMKNADTKNVIDKIPTVVF